MKLHFASIIILSLGALIKATEISNGGSSVGHKGGVLVHEETEMVEVLRLPEGFDYRDPALGIQQREDGVFLIPDYAKIDGANLTTMAVTVQTWCETTPASPFVTDIIQLTYYLYGIKDWNCCQMRKDFPCTNMKKYASAATDICGPYLACHKCQLSGESTQKIFKSCMNSKWGKAGGYVRRIYDGWFPYMTDVNVYHT
ncbi:hypothetical protein FN846DRAFT_944614 [Sphaerosporella brunnea]|uniref:Uncharacterized protein n=1 Tax=Sphaerosporella brunnea TaxID=1250544 RepID=A0A5J5F072_9PEZI|nr:hypothetical protein FN846DRAFT_944614 [Sphaerosporella brunnea]